MSTPHKLFTPFTLRSVTFPNRLGIPPMCTYLCDKFDGLANDLHLIKYGSYADSGFGSIVVEATGVVPEGRITPGDMGLWDDKFIAPLARIPAACHHYGTKVGIQLGHSGRKNTFFAAKKGGYIPADYPNKVVGPSPIRYNNDHDLPEEMSIEDIHAVTKAFGDAAERAVKAGFDFIEIHAAHGYLLHQFLSPLSNQRSDVYGGSYENRSRFVKEVSKEIRTRIPESMPLFVRISMTDYAEGGWDFAEAKVLCKELVSSHGVDLMHLSSSALSSTQVIPKNWRHQLDRAKEFKEELQIPIAGVGGVWNAETAADAVNDGIDLIMVGKAALRGAFVPRRIAVELGSPVVPDFFIGYKWGCGVPAHCDY